MAASQQRQRFTYVFPNTTDAGVISLQKLPNVLLNKEKTFVETTFYSIPKEMLLIYTWALHFFDKEIYKLDYYPDDILPVSIKNKLLNKNSDVLSPLSLYFKHNKISINLIADNPSYEFSLDKVPSSTININTDQQLELKLKNDYEYFLSLYYEKYAKQ